MGKKKSIVGSEKKEIRVQKMSKEKKEGSIGLLIEKFEDDLVRFKKHVFNINQQFLAYRMCKDNLKVNEALLHIDFSENYLCKLSEEVQTFHYGGSRAQATLHTGVLYIGGEIKPISFCTISPSNDHSPAAIWAHLKPILELLKCKAPNISIIHFFSDGPCTQYRQKKNFYLFTHLLFEYGFKKGTWSYFEAGHGKGAADGIGAVIKRTADSFISYGQDIFDARELYEKIHGKTVVKVFFINDNDIHCVQNYLPSQIPSLSGTFNVHQISSNEKGKFFYRNVSCNCKKNGFCECFPMKEFSFKKDHKPKKKLKAQNFIRQKIYSSSSNSDISINSDNEFYAELDRKHDMSLEEVSINKMCEGAHVLVEFIGGSRKKTKYIYAAVIQNKIDDEGEIKIMCLKANDCNRKIFHIDENDISYVNFEQIIAILPQPKLTMKGNRIFYEFPIPFNTYEK